MIDSVFHNLIGSNPLSCLAAAAAASLPACAEKRFSRSGRRGGGLTANAEPPLRPCPPEMVAFRSARRLDLVPLAPGVARLKFYPQEQSPKTGRATFFFFFFPRSLDPTHIRTHAHTSRPPSQTESFSPETKSRPRTHRERERATRGGSCAPVTGGAAAVNKPGRCSWVRTVSAARFGSFFPLFLSLFFIYFLFFYEKQNKKTKNKPNFNLAPPPSFKRDRTERISCRKLRGPLPSRPDLLGEARLRDQKRICAAVSRRPHKRM